MGLLQENKAIFYHPLNDLWEYQAPTTAWAKSSGSLAGGGKVSRALSREDIAAGVSGDTNDYDSAAAATKVAFCGWFRNPSETPPQTAAPTTDSPIGDAATSCSGTGVNGAAVEVFIDDVSDGSADGVVAGGVWSKTDLTAVSAGEVVSAKQRTISELESDESNEVTVLAYSAAPTADSPIGAGATSCSGTGVNGSTVEVFIDDVSDGNADGIVAGGVWSKTDLTSVSAGEVVSAKQTESGKLQGAESNEVTVQAYSAAPTTDTPIYDAATSCSGTGVNGATVEVFVDDVSVGNADAVVSGGTWSKTGMAAVSEGDVVSAKQTEAGKLQGGESNEVTVEVGGPSFGSQVEFSNYTLGATAVTKIDATHVFVAYEVSTGGVFGKVGTITGSSIAFGSEEGFGASSGSGYISCDTLDSTHVVVLWLSSTNAIWSMIGLISGTTITTGGIASLNGASAYPRVAALDSTHFVGVGRETARAFARVASVSGTTIAYGTKEQMHFGNTAYTNVAAISATKFVGVYSDADASNAGKAKVGTISGGTAVSFGSEATWMSSGATYDIWMTGLGDGVHVVIGYGKSGAGTVTKIGTVASGGSGTTVSFGAESNEFRGHPVEIDLTALSTTKIMAVGRDGLDGNYAKVSEGAVSGTTITLGSPSGALGGASLKQAIAAISATQAVATYKDNGDSGHGKANVVTAIP